jgi:hypothetical protein
VVTDSPFALLTLIAAPAVLTNACALLALNTANRYGRAFDRSRQVGRELESTREDDELLSFRLSLLRRLVARAMLLLRAQTAFYLATGLFVMSALLALPGAALTPAHPELMRAFAALSFAIGAIAGACLVQGCIYTVHETRLAMTGLREEETLLQTRHGGALRAQAPGRLASPR